jgi:hypothetical protein
MLALPTHTHTARHKSHRSVYIYIRGERFCAQRGKYACKKSITIYFQQPERFTTSLFARCRENPRSTPAKHAQHTKQ